MSIYRCKMCGASLDCNGDETISICKYCGTQQMLDGVEIPKDFADEAEAIRVKNHRDNIDKSNQKVKKFFWVVLAFSVLLPTIPFFVKPEIISYMGVEGISGIAASVLMAFVVCFVQLILNFPALITTIIYVLIKPKRKKTIKLVRFFNVLSKVFLFSEIGFFLMIGLVGFGTDTVDVVLSSMFLLLTLCNIGLLVISFIKKDYKY